MKIVTGHKGEDHVTSADFQALNQGMFGTGNYVLNVGNKFSATMPDATHVVITDGEGVMQGVHFRTERGSTDTVKIDAGATGVNRVDFVGALYEKDTQGVESVTWAIAKGTAVSGTPTDPTYATGDILAGDSPVFYPMYKVVFEGVTPTLSQMAKVSSSMAKIVVYEGTREVYSNSGASASVADLPSNNFVVIGAMCKISNGAWKDKTISYIQPVSHDYYLNIECSINNNKLYVWLYNDTSSTANISYRVVLMELDN